MKSKSTAEMTLGQFVQNHRERMGISLRELARRLKTSSSFVSWIERDKGFPSTPVLEKIANLFEVPIEEIKKFDDRVSTVKLQRTLERNGNLRAAVRLMIQEIDEGRSGADGFAKAILGVTNRNRRPAR